MSKKEQTSKPEGLSPEPLTHQPTKANLKAERIQEALRKAPGWSLRGEDAIHRTRQFASLAEAEAYASFVGRLAACKSQPVTIAFNGKRVAVTLTGHPVKGCVGGLTKAVFKLAAILG